MQTTLLSFLLVFLLSPAALPNPNNQPASQPHAFDPSIYALMNGNIWHFLLVKNLPILQQCSFKTQIGAGLLILGATQFFTHAPELAKRYLFSTDERSESRRNLLKVIREVGIDEAAQFSNLFFNENTKLEIEAVLTRIETAALRDQPLTTILFYGPPGTGKTELAKSFVHLGFQVFIFPSHILRDEPMFREVFAEISRRGDKRKQAAIVDDAEFFFNALGPNTAGMRTSARDELESSFRTEIGSDNAKLLVIFTSNKVSDIENDTTGAIKRRFKNKILVPLPNQATRKEMLCSLISSSLSRFGFSLQTSDDFFNDTVMDKFFAATEGVCQDQLKQQIDNAIFLAKNRGESALMQPKDILFFAERNRIDEAWMKEQATKEIENELAILRRQVEIKELRKKLQDSATEPNSHNAQRGAQPL